jgi:HTH-type transcriptional regulator, sugar sensing transcriptional regulator
MDALEMLQQLGFSSYEAAAYTALLARGPLTGYEVGKYSRVPLSRSYEILQRLQQKGLVLLQPGDPARYLAQDPQHMLANFRSGIEQTLDNLTTLLDRFPTVTAMHEFWVIRQRNNILTQFQNMIEHAQNSIMLTLPVDYTEHVSDALLKAQGRGCLVVRARPSIDKATHAPLLLLIDNHQALIGTVEPADTCQAVSSTHEALLLAVRSYFDAGESRVDTIGSSAHPTSAPGWLAWEERKQRRVHIGLRSA